MKWLSLGIDAGATGAVAFLDGNTGRLLGIQDMPISLVEVNGSKTRKRVSAHQLLLMLPMVGPADRVSVLIERPEGRPIRFREKEMGTIQTRQPGAAGMLAFGESFGIAMACCAARNIVINELRPGQWKRAVGVGAGKDECRGRAAQLFPEMTRLFVRVKDHDRAEAALMALYNWRVNMGGK